MGKNELNIYELLYELCEDESVYDPNCELIESGLLDSFAYIELFSRLEDYGISLHPTQIDRQKLKTPRLIEELMKENM